MSNQSTCQFIVEALLSARHVDVTDHDEVSSRCREHAVPEVKLRAMIDVFGPLSESLSVYLTR
jgi:hypothetical protein